MARSLPSLYEMVPGIMLFLCNAAGICPVHSLVRTILKSLVPLPMFSREATINYLTNSKGVQFIKGQRKGSGQFDL